MKSDPETAGFMDRTSIWFGPSTTIAVVPIRRGTRVFHTATAETNYGQGDNGWQGLTSSTRETRILQMV